MATVLPPPSKRQRTDAAERAREQQTVEEIPSDAGTLRLNFFDETTGLPIGNGPVLVPVADATPKNLELLVNKLQGHVGYIFDFSLLLFMDNSSRGDSAGKGILWCLKVRFLLFPHAFSLQIGRGLGDAVLNH